MFFNKDICSEYGHKHHCYGIDKVESALHSAFYPGIPPYQHGGIAKVAGAMAFYLNKAHAFFDGNKRTAVLASAIFMDLNGFSLNYPQDPDALYLLMEDCACDRVEKDDIIQWYENHKV